MTRYYKFSVETGELVGFIDSEKRYPANHLSLTAIEPPEAQEGYARVFNREAQEWSQVQDHIGEKVYSTETGAETEVKELGPIPEGMTTEKRPDETYKHTERGWEQDATLKAEFDKRKADEMAREAARQRVSTSETVSAEDLAIALGLRTPKQVASLR